MSHWAPGLCFYGQATKKLFSPGKRSRRTDLTGVCSFLMRGSGRPWGNGWSCVRGELVGYFQKRFFPLRVVTQWNRLPTQGMVTISRLPEHIEHLGNAFRHRMGLLGCPVQTQEPDWVILGVHPWYWAPPSAGMCRVPSPEREWAELAQPEVIHTFHFLSSGCGVAFWLYFSSVRRNFSSS